MEHIVKIYMLQRLYISKILGGAMKKRKNYWAEDLESEDVYDEEYINELLEDDEISVEEEGFMRGYNTTE